MDKKYNKRTKNADVKWKTIKNKYDFIKCQFFGLFGFNFVVSVDGLIS